MANGGNRGRNPTIRNLICATANIEYATTIPAGTKQLQIKCRDEDGSDTIDDIRMAFVAGKVSTPIAPYGIIPKGMVFYNDFLDYTVAGTLFIASPTAGVVAEIQTWQ